MRRRLRFAVAHLELHQIVRRKSLYRATVSPSTYRKIQSREFRLLIQYIEVFLLFEIYIQNTINQITRDKKYEIMKACADRLKKKTVI